MNYHQEWADENGELSEFDLVDSSEPPPEEDPEASLTESQGEVPDEVDPADAAEQKAEVPEDDEEPHGD